MALAACGGQTTYIQKTQKSLAVTQETLQIAQKAFVSWDDAHQQAIVASATTQDEATKALADYRDKRQPVIKAFTIAYSSIAAATAMIPLVQDGVKKETDLGVLLRDTLSAALEVKSAIEALKNL
jgi:hypothetical protein